MKRKMRQSVILYSNVGYIKVKLLLEVEIEKILVWELIGSLDACGFLSVMSCE